jgi:hypothetical protein
MEDLSRSVVTSLAVLIALLITGLVMAGMLLRPGGAERLLPRQPRSGPDPDRDGAAVRAHQPGRLLPVRWLMALLWPAGCRVGLIPMASRSDAP